MSSQQTNVWQTAARNRNSQSTSRTPQSRSGNASPAQQGNPTQPPRQDAAKPTNVWAQRSSQSGERQQHTASSNGPISATPQSEEAYAPANGFNAADVRTFLGREAQGMPANHKVQDGRSSGNAWGNKANHTAGGQPFFVQLAKQVATLEGGG